MSFPRKYLGHGVGLRTRHFGRFLAEPSGPGDGASVDWFEAISENFMIPGGRPLAVLERVRRDHPVVLHGVSLSIGSTDPLDRRYLRELAALAERIQPAWLSDHLCWGSVGGHHAHDLLPLPFTEEALALCVERVEKVQEALGRQILLENVSSYLTYRASAMPEWEFLSQVAERADCGILLDVNNVYVSAHNHGFDALTYVRSLPPERVGQIHLAGHQDRGRYLFDSHDGPVIRPVWKLYREALRHVGRVSTLIEWDEAIPDFPRLAAEAARSRTLMQETLVETGSKVA